MSKYIEFSSMSMADFAKSKPGTIAKFMLKPGSKSRTEVAKSLKSVCSKNGVTCSLESTNVLVEGEDDSWRSSRILTATMN